MKAFRETFSRPVKSIRFLGLFDTVNSVPRFETAWMQRSKFPYTARSSAKVRPDCCATKFQRLRACIDIFSPKVIRHCVSIDERRAKFRQDLIYQGAQQKPQKKRLSHHSKNLHDFVHDRYRTRRQSVPLPTDTKEDPNRGRRDTLSPNDGEYAFRPRSRSRSRATNRSSRCGNSIDDGKSYVSGDSDADSDSDPQDIDEVW